MAISEFENIAECSYCKKKGFTGRDSVEEETTAVTDEDEIMQSEIWKWTCKYCRKQNKIIYSVYNIRLKKEE